MTSTSASVAPYFELDRVLHDGVFYAAHELYGLTFKERHDLPVYQQDVRVFEVFDADGKPLALFLGDYFARDNKQGGAWMNEYVSQSRLLKRLPVVANHLNIPKPQAGQPALLTFDEVTAMFHEFGHALHGMLSNVQYPLLAGTEVPRDFVEYPSQFNEMWAREPEVVAHFARHYQTGAPMPPALLAQVLAAQKFDVGYATTEYLAAALLDQAWYQITPAQAPEAAGVPAFEAAALKRAASITRRCRRAITPPISRTSSTTATRRATTLTCGARCWRATPASGSTHTADSRAPTASTCAPKSCRAGAARIRRQLFRELLRAGAPEVGPLLEYKGLSGGG